ncbi:CaiB/BaiF CoA transferase family protein [Actinoalloteichus hymeniacidonis]|uniref:Acyl-CoA transferase/carnitine dehydratase n=1 Tax=Actinoalloteichus hymeniacidonis TaxID=340345 RepID=A0AAC9MYV4_9PSEU|nr:CoA transferase [Actinoalloteichus hymeniacidonis]AOS63392.1 putative acyl-CoA transferase/carnitine dehydratase [Actinoalloteichus hymeniacidonis]MBB5908567.1 crotonobetainyl-CoA:carnitine CoA-transferase CaiB-like acyl-CoA transferase [Actinoalloteichus hymeniacidonis]
MSGPTTPTTDGPLAGLRVLDLSRFIAGPLCCQILGDMGAEVIKVERPGGEDGRRHVPFHQGHSVYPMIFNRNKHGITLDTRHPRALPILERFVAEVDVVVENYRPGTMAAMGLGYDRLKEINPRVVLTSISGFGQTGPNTQRALFDAIAQAASGLMSLTGKPEDEPTMTGTFVADYISAFHGVMGILLALSARERTGLGQHVDISCVDALFACLGTHPSAYAMLGETRQRSGSRDQITVPANVYPAADGHVYIHAGTNPLFPRLCTAMGRPNLAEDPRFLDQTARLANVEELDELVRTWTEALTCEQIDAHLTEVGVPFSKVVTVAEAVESDQVAAREMLLDVEHPALGTLTLPGIPIKLSDTPGKVRKPPPLAGEDNDAVYRRVLGVDAAEVARMRADGVI